MQAKPSNEMMSSPLRVVSVRKVKKSDREHVLYVGRKCYGWQAHPLANPFKVESIVACCASVTHQQVLLDKNLDECLAKYSAWLDSLPNRDELLMGVWINSNFGVKPLGCWCGEWPAQPGLKCHAVVIANRVQELITRKGMV